MSSTADQIRAGEPTESVSLGGFPPTHHVSRDLGLVFRFLSLTEAETTLPLTDHLRDELGVLWPELLVAVFDEAAAAASVFACLPDWMTTLDLSVVLAPRPARGDTLRVRTRVVRAGRRVIVLASEARSGGRRVGSASIGFARVPQTGSADGFTLEAPDPTETYDLAVAGSGLHARFPVAVGYRRSPVSGAVLELALCSYVGNTEGTLHGGVAAGLAARSAEIMAPGSRVRHAHFRFLSPGSVGPFTTRVVGLGGDRTAQSWEVVTVDAGDGDRLLMTSTVTTTRPG